MSSLWWGCDLKKSRERCHSALSRFEIRQNTSGYLKPEPIPSALRVRRLFRLSRTDPWRTRIYYQIALSYLGSAPYGLSLPRLLPASHSHCPTPPPASLRARWRLERLPAACLVSTTVTDTRLQVQVSLHPFLLSPHLTPLPLNPGRRLARVTSQSPARGSSPHSLHLSHVFASSRSWPLARYLGIP
jgi:hypothetical protein